MTSEAEEVRIVGLGAQGDGIAEAAAREAYVPFALPGERWRCEEGKPPVLIEAHPERAAPLCPHFGSCGGCDAQHMPEALYVAWKREIVVQALGHRGIRAPVADLVRVPLASRRRLTIYGRRYRKNLHLGFYRAATNYIMDITQCPIAEPALVAALPVLREMLEPMLSGKAEAAIRLLATSAGVDVDMSFIHLEGQRKHYPRLAALAAKHGIARLAVEDETIMLERPPALVLGGVDIVPPPGLFVQAVQAAETEMVRLAVIATTGARRTADLFCGAGTFTFALARRARVLALDSYASAIETLSAAARRAQGLKPIEAKVRDLYRMPLSSRELDGFDAAVFNPARSGAEAQAGELARSKVATVVAVSCNPGTLARDLRLLIDGGYTLERVTPIDQFLFSHHVEAVAVLRR